MLVLDGVTKRFGKAAAMSGVIGRLGAGECTALRTISRLAAKREAWTPLNIPPASVWRRDPRA